MVARSLAESLLRVGDRLSHRRAFPLSARPAGRRRGADRANLRRTSSQRRRRVVFPCQPRIRGGEATASAVVRCPPGSTAARARGGPRGEWRAATARVIAADSSRNATARRNKRDESRWCAPPRRPKRCRPDAVATCAVGGGHLRVHDGADQGMANLIAPSATSMTFASKAAQVVAGRRSRSRSPRSKGGRAAPPQQGRRGSRAAAVLSSRQQKAQIVAHRQRLAWLGWRFVCEWRARARSCEERIPRSFVICVGEGGA